MDLRTEVYVINTDRKIYKISALRELQSNEHGLLYTFDLVAGYDYINPDENDIQGFVGADNFIDEVQSEDLTVYPLTESLGDRLKENDFTVINIADYTIHN